MKLTAEISGSATSIPVLVHVAEPQDQHDKRSSRKACCARKIHDTDAFLKI